MFMSEKTIFLELFGENPTLKVLDFLIVNDDFDYSMTDIATNSGIGYSTLKSLWNSLELNNIVKLTRVVGKAKMYRLDSSNNIVQKFKKLYWETTKTVVHSKIKKEIIV